MDISITPLVYAAALNDLRTAMLSFRRAITFSVFKPSGSKAMPAFVDEVDRMKTILLSYEQLLEKDYQSLRAILSSFKRFDKCIGISILEIPESRYIAIAKNTSKSTPIIYASNK